MEMFGDKNVVQAGENVSITGRIAGNNNSIVIGNARSKSVVRVNINGNNNNVEIGNSYQIKELAISCGNHVQANATSLRIGHGFSIEPNCAFLLYNSGNILSIGDDCLFSTGVTIRCGESPHLIFELNTGEYLDVSDGVFIGKHTWIGERVYITKKVTVPDNCIVAACSVVTKRFSDVNSVIAGNPAKVVRNNIHWVRNADFLKNGSIFKKGFEDYISRSGSEAAG